MTHREPEEIGLELLAISNELDRLKKLKFQAESIEIAKRQVCCTDVCNIINNILRQKDKELTNIDKKKYEIEEQLFKTGIEISKADTIWKKESEIVRNKMKELENLKIILRAHNVCKCPSFKTT